MDYSGLVVALGIACSVALVTLALGYYLGRRKGRQERPLPWEKELALSKLPDALLVVRAGGNIVFANEAAERLLGPSLEGKNFYLLARELEIEPREDFLRLLSERGEALIRVKGRLLEATAERSVIREEVRSVISLHDVTHARIVEEVDHELGVSLEPERILNLILRRAVEVTGAALGSISVLEPEGKSLKVLARYGAAPELVKLTSWPADKGLVGKVIKTGKPILAPDVSQEPDYEPLVPTTRSEMVVPLIWEERVVGALNLESNLPSAFTGEDLRMVQHLAEHAVMALEKARLYQEAQRRLAELSGLHEISRTISALTDLREVYRELTHRIAVLMNVQMCGILLYNEEEEALISQMPFYGVPEELVQFYRIPIPKGSVPWRIWQEEDFFISNDVASDPLAEETGLRDLAAITGVRSTIMVPMTIGKRRIGVVQASNKLDGSPFTEEDARLLTIFANQAAAVVENARLYEAERRRAREAQTLLQVSQAIGSTLDLGQVMQTLLAHTKSLFEADVVAFALIEEGGFSFQAFEGLSEEEVKLLEKGVARAAFSPIGRQMLLRQEPLIIEDVDKMGPGPRPMRGFLPDVKAALHLPLISKGKVIGMLIVAWRQPRRLSRAEAEMAMGIANQAAIAIENARLYGLTDEKLRARVEEMSSLARIGRELAATLELNRILTVVLEEAIRATRADRGTLGFIDRDTGVFKMRVIRGFTDEEEERLQDLNLMAVRSITRRVATTGQPALVPDVSQDPDYLAGSPQTRSQLTVPIFYEEQVVGVINVESNELAAFTDDHLRFLQSLADAASVAIGNARRYEEQMRLNERIRRRTEQLSSLLSIGQSFRSDQPLEGVMEDIAYAIQETVGFNQVLISLVEGDPPMLRRVAGAGIPLAVFQEMQKIRQPLSRLEEVMQEEFRISQSYFIPHTRKEVWEGKLHTFTAYEQMAEREEEGAWHPEDMLFVPLRDSLGRMVGLISVDEPQDGRLPTLTTIEALEIFATQAAMIIENARLYEEARRRAEQLSTLYEIGKEIASTLDLDRVLSSIVEDAVRLTGAEKSLLLLVDPETRRIIKATDHGYPPEAVESFSYREFEEGISGWVMRKGEPTLVTDASKDPRNRGIAREMAQKFGKGVPLAIAPLLIKGRFIGTLTVAGAAGSPPFTQETLDLVLMLADQAAVAVENARLFAAEQERRRIADTLREVTGVVTSTLNLNEVLELILDQMGKVVPYDTASIQLLRDDHLEIIAGRGFADMSQVLGLTFPAYGDNPNRVVVEGRKPHIVMDTHAVYPIFREPPHSHIRSWLGVPLLFRDKLIGMITLDKTTVGFYTEEHARLAMTFANQAAIAIENARLYEEARRRAEEMASLYRLGLATTAVMELDQLLEVIYQQLRQVMNTDTIYIALYEPEREEIRFELFYDRGQRLDKFTRPLEEGGFTSWIIRHRRSLLVKDMEKEEPHLAVKSMTIGEPARSWLGVPLIAREEVVGVLSVQSYEVNAFDENSQRFLEAVAAQVSVSIDNARLYEKERRRAARLGVLTQVATQITAILDQQEMLRKAVESVRRGLGYSQVAVFLLDEEKQELFSAAVDGLYRELIKPDYRQPVGVGLIGWAAHTGEVQLANDTSKDPHFICIGDYCPGSELCIPIRIGERLLGVLDIEAEERGAFDDEDVAAMRILADQLAVGLENIRLFQATMRSAEEMRLLYELGVACSAALELEELLSVLAKSARSLTRTDISTAIVLDQATGEYIWKVDAEDEKAAQILLAHKPRREGLTSLIIRKGEPLIVPDVTKDRRVSRDVLRSGIRSLMGVPISLEGKPIGAIFVNSLQPRSFTQKEVQLLSFLANQAAVAVRNAQLYEEIRRFSQELEERVEERTKELQKALEDLTLERDRVESLYRITRDISTSLDVDRVLAQTLALVNEAVGAPQGAIMLLDHVSGQLIYRAALGRAKPLPRGGKPTPFRPGVGLAGWVIERRKPAIVEDVSKDPRWVADPDEPEVRKAALAVPLMMGEDVLGALLLFHPQPGYFTEAHLKLVSAAATQVATAINNAELYRLITEQAERLGEMLRQQQIEAGKSQAILNSIADGVLVLDVQNRVILMNPAAEQILGIRAEDLVDKPLHRIRELGRTEEDKELTLRFYENLASKRVEAGGPPIRFQVEAAGKVIAVTLSPVVLAGGELPGTVAVLRDITREVEIDRMKDEFISTVSHELRTPMTAIKGYTDLLVMETVGALNETQRRFLNIIKSNADRLSALVSDVLDISRIEAGRIKLNIQPLSIAEIAKEVWEAFRRQAEEKQLAFTLCIPEGLPPVRGDRDRVTQILSNLVANACQYTLPGGKVTVSAALEDGFVRVDVSDTGIGIAPEDLPRVFDRFFRADHPLVQEVGGTGLGLSIVKAFVEMLGGRVWVESELDKGSTFSFTLPVAVEETPELEELPVSALPPRRKVLVVDDEPHIAELIRRQLEGEGFKVMVTYRGEDAIRLAREEKPDLITLDILLEDMDGFEVLERMKADKAIADIPVIIVSIVAEKEKGFALGAADYVVKPFEEARLLESIRNVLRSLDGEQAKRILVVDDDRDTVTWLLEALKAYGFQARGAYDGAEALRIAREESPDLILLDLKMPGMDGYEFIRRLRSEESTRHIPIIVVTASPVDKEKDRVKMLGMGAKQFLTKPFSAEALVAEIRKALEA